MRGLNDKKKFCNLYNTKNMYKKCAENVGIKAMHKICKDASAISAQTNPSVDQAIAQSFRMHDY